MNTAAAAPAPGADRLQRLEAFLREDPHNPQLLADACQQALGCGALERAEAHLFTARQLHLQAPLWVHVQARLNMARSDWEGARSVVAPWLSAEATPDPSARAALQCLWLRASHHAGLLDEAWQWATQAAASGDLQPVAAGVASLIAVDLGLFAEAKGLAETAAAAGAAPPEALVARASVALAEGDTAAAREALRPALEASPDDGRTWSTLGLASLQARDFVAARSQFARASQLMPGHVGTLHGLGWACLLLQDRAGALSAFQQALQVDANFAESHGAVGLVLALAGRGEEAEHHLARAERLDRRSVTARYARALLRGQAQDLQALRHLAERLLDRPGLFGRRIIDNVDAAGRGRGAGEK